MRYDDKGNLIKDFILNNEPYLNSQILIAGRTLDVDHQESTPLGHFWILASDVL